MTSGLRYSSYQAAWEQWAKDWGGRVMGIGSDANAFVTNLLRDNRGIFGPTIGGDHRGAYNSEDPDWKDKVLRTIQSVRKRLPLWPGNLDRRP